jgi:hypothetical protein
VCIFGQSPRPILIELFTCGLRLLEENADYWDENRGHSLEHLAVLREPLTLGRVAKGQSFSKDVSFPLEHSAQSYRMVAFLEERHQGKVLGAALARWPQ